MTVMFDDTAAGEYLGGKESPVPRATLQYWRGIGNGPRYSKFGRNVRYSQEALDAFLADNTRGSTSEIKPEQKTSTLGG